MIQAGDAKTGLSVKVFDKSSEGGYATSKKKKKLNEHNPTRQNLFVSYPLLTLVGNCILSFFKIVNAVYVPGPNAISVSISPLNRYILVGLASRRTIFVSSVQLVGQVFRLVKEKAGESSTKVRVCVHCERNESCVFCMHQW